MLLQDKRIAIIGGGPGGLTLARLLQLQGAQVNVYERDLNKDVRVQGATLDLHEESGLKALEEAGLTDAFYANYRPLAGRLRITDEHALIHSDDHESEDALAENRPEIDRGPLRHILLDSLEPGTVVWDSQFSSMEKQESGWLIRFKNGSTSYADLVIGADGANSRLRLYLTDIRPVYSGVTIVEGTIYRAEENAPELYRLVKGGKLFAFGHEQSLILSAKGDGSLSFYTGCKVPENWVIESGIDFNNLEQVKQWFGKAYGSWSPVWQELFASTELSIIPRPQYHFPLNQSWATLPDLTLIGDAAHRMPPYAGEGVNMAMQDALELAECLGSKEFTDIRSALAAFEKRMLERTSEVTRLTLENTEMLHAKDALESMMTMVRG